MTKIAVTGSELLNVVRKIGVIGTLSKDDDDDDDDVDENGT